MTLLFTKSFGKHLWRVYYVPGPVLSVGTPGLKASRARRQGSRQLQCRAELGASGARQPLSLVGFFSRSLSIQGLLVGEGTVTELRTAAEYQLPRQ